MNIRGINIMSKKIDMPVMNVKLVDINKVQTNEYNPNIVAPPVIKILKI